MKSKDDSQRVGLICECMLGGLLGEALPDSDYFDLQFPVDLDVRVKAVQLGATFPVDYVFFQKPRGLGHSANTS